MKKRIYIAYTGGTIGMQRSSHGYVPQAGFMENCLAGMPEFHREEMPEYVIHEYNPLIDSSDMTPADWQRIAEDIRDHYDAFDGFVVLHGTDTMSFTASALSFMLEDLTKPEYAKLLVVEDPAASSPGLAFLVGTIEAMGEDGYQDYWQSLRVPQPIIGVTVPGIWNVYVSFATAEL